MYILFLFSMEPLTILWSEILNFFGVSQFLSIVGTRQYESFLSSDGLIALLLPLIPLLVCAEFILGIVYKKPQMEVYKVAFLIYVLNRFITRSIALSMVAVCIGVLGSYALVEISNTWYWFIYAYVVWELAHYVYHFMAHKVRLFWCLHATHHAPQEMNLSVTYAHFALEPLFADIIRTSICTVLGVPPAMLFIIMFIDGTYGAFIHIGETAIKDARFGLLCKIILTPSHHRVHHAQNRCYIDKNYCNLLNIWDRIFGTYQEEVSAEPIRYGITRKMNPHSFTEMYFGEAMHLFHDVVKAPGLPNKLRYCLKPPGWRYDEL